MSNSGGVGINNQVQITLCLGTLSAITGVVVGVVALYAGMSQSTALWTQVGLFGGIAFSTGLIVSLKNPKIHKLNIFMAIITTLTLPVLFGSLGALDYIPPYHMLWAATSICGGAVLLSAVGNLGKVIYDASCNSDDDKGLGLD